MDERRQRIKAFFTDYRMALIIRWWAAGAVYFFIGWGTSVGNQSNIIDFVFSLGVVMGMFNMLIVNPVIRMAYNISPSRRPKTYALSQRISDYLVEIIKNILIMFVIALIYIGLNSIINVIFGLSSTTITIPGEPILFGVFYVLMWLLFERIKARAVDYWKKRNA